MTVFICQASEPVPETRIDQECTSEELIGVFTTRERAELAYAEYLARRMDEWFDEIKGYNDPDEDPLVVATEYTSEITMVITESEVQS